MVWYACGGEAVFVCRERALQLWLKLVSDRALPGLFQQQQQQQLSNSRSSCGNTIH